jgi:hypothetical protein
MNAEIIVSLIIIIACLITWNTKLRKDNTRKDDQISIRDQALRYKDEIIERMHGNRLNGKNGKS